MPNCHKNQVKSVDKDQFFLWKQALWVYPKCCFPKHIFLISKISSGGVKKCPGQRRVSLLFTAGLKYAWVGSVWVRAHLYYLGIDYSDGSGSGHFFVAQVRSVWVSHLWVWKISPQNSIVFNFFPSDQNESHSVGSKNTRVNDGPATYLLRVKSMLGSGPISDWFSC